MVQVMNAIATRTKAIVLFVSQVVGNEGPICHFDFAAELPESC